MYAGGNELTQSILAGGRYAILRSFSGQQGTLALVYQHFFDGLTRVVGVARTARIKEAGLCKLHEFVSVAELPEIKRYVNTRLKQAIHRLAYDVGHDALGLHEEFWISDLVITRIHYPFQLKTRPETADADASANGDATQVPGAASTSFVQAKRQLETTWAEWRKYARLFSPPVVLANVRPVSRQVANWVRFRSTFGRYPFTSVKGIETAAVHGPHLDIWNGLPFDGITLWWAIDGVTEEGGLLVYPDLFHTTMPRWAETRIGQAAIGLVYPPPHKIGLNSGELLMFSHDHMYHASHTNVSDQTRIAVSTHICATTPVFSRETRFAFENFFSSEDIARGVFKTKRFSFHGNSKPATNGKSTETAVTPPTIVRTRGKLAGGARLRICSSEALPDNHKLLACFDDTSVIVARSAGDLFCVSSICPHRGHNLAHGALDHGRLLCPGHGVAFDLRDGSSLCDALKLSVYHAVEEDGTIWVESLPVTTRPDVAERQGAGAPA